MRKAEQCSHHPTVATSTSNDKNYISMQVSMS